MRLRNPETMRLEEKYGAVKTWLWCEGGSNKGAFKQNQHAQVHGTWWAASTSVGCHCKAALDYHLRRKSSWWLGEVPEDWKREQMSPSSWRRAKKCEELQDKKLCLYLEKIVKKKNLETIFEHFVDKVIGRNHRVRKWKWSHGNTSICEQQIGSLTGIY